MINFGPQTQLTAVIDNWVPYYTRRVQEELDGKWTSQDTWGGLASQMVLMAPYTNMPDAVKALAMETETALKAGTLQPFACPISDRDGNSIEFQDGNHVSDLQVRSMNFYVKGIGEKIPGK
jgi:basic membrane protein A and related proteins